MSENSKIEWTDHTFNPWEGCTKVSSGCDHCYAEVRNARYAGGESINWGVGAPRRRTSEANWKNPIKWNKNHAQFFAEHGRRQRVFCASLADVFDNEVNPEWRRDLFDLIELTPNLDWLLLTKRIGNVFKMVSEAKSHDWLVGQKNVWLGATIVNQIEADRDIPKLLQIPASVRFLSMEPLLGAVNIFSEVDGWGLHTYDGYECEPRWVNWVIVGGESGSNARPMHPQWAKSIQKQCAAAVVPFFFKQWGEWAPDSLRAGGDLGGDMRKGFVQHVCLDRENDGHFRNGDCHMRLVGKSKAGSALGGIEYKEFPRSAS